VRRWVRAASWVFFFATIYLILAAAVAPWLRLPELGDVGFTLVFVLFALAHCTVMYGLRFTMAFFVISAVVSYFLEETGVRTGIIYGFYHYGDMLGSKLGHVPIIIPLAWFMMVYPSWMVARAVVHNVDEWSFAGLSVVAGIAALVMTGWDMVMDPGMALAQNWIWERGGAYFGVPRRNYLGWLLTTFLIYSLAGLIWSRLKPESTSGRTFAALPVMVYAFYALRYILNNRFPALEVVAVFSMAMPALLALVQLSIGQSASQRVGWSASQQVETRGCFRL
jgi:uncharacterized membrane protein